jgi:hypothetical protein
MDDPITTPQRATLVFPNGAEWKGVLLEVTATKVKFQTPNQAKDRTGLSAFSAYDRADVQAIRTSDGKKYVYNADKDRFERKSSP